MKKYLLILSAAASLASCNMETKKAELPTRANNTITKHYSDSTVIETITTFYVIDYGMQIPTGSIIHAETFNKSGELVYTFHSNF